ncbi:hypothetical protein L7F22_004253 [Adiantum nelumboides]|nr:hypothetical protein [Adiantum nelumboides]
MRRRNQESTNSAPPSWAMHPSSVASYMEDCEEYFPLSPSNEASEGMTYSAMMEEALHSIPNQCKLENSSQLQDFPTQSPASSAKEQPGVSQEQPKPSPSTVAKEVGKGTKRPRTSAVQWDDKSTHTLLRVYEETWTHIKKENFRAKDWEDLTFALNREVDATFSSEQTRNRIDTLKKYHKKELTKVNATGFAPSTWPLYDTCDALWGRTPKATGIACALDSDARKSSTTEVPAQFDFEEDGGSSQNPNPDSVLIIDIDLDGVVGKK